MDSASGAGASAPNGGEGPSSASGGCGGGGGGSGESGSTAAPPPPPPSRYESQKRRDWNTFLQYLKSHKPPLTLVRCSGAHVIEFLKYLDQFGKTKVHVTGCPYFGLPSPPAPCACPLKQAWGSLDALIGRLRAAYEESGGRRESNPFGTKAVRIYLREVREGQAKARGIPYEKKKRKRPTAVTAAAAAANASVAAIAATPVGDVDTGVGGTSSGGDGGGGGGTIGATAPVASVAAPTTTTTTIAGSTPMNGT